MIMPANMPGMPAPDRGNYHDIGADDEDVHGENPCVVKVHYVI